MCSMPWVDIDMEKGSDEKGVHYWRKIIWVFHVVKGGLASVGLGCLRSWNEL